FSCSFSHLHTLHFSPLFFFFMLLKLSSPLIFCLRPYTTLFRSVFVLRSSSPKKHENIYQSSRTRQKTYIRKPRPSRIKHKNNYHEQDKRTRQANRRNLNPF